MMDTYTSLYSHIFMVALNLLTALVHLSYGYSSSVVTKNIAKVSYPELCITYTETQRASVIQQLYWPQRVSFK